jgi:hypothetical protein
MSDGLTAVLVMASPFIIYIAARLIGAGWFKSKQQFDRATKGR